MIFFCFGSTTYHTYLLLYSLLNSSNKVHACSVVILLSANISTISLKWVWYCAFISDLLLRSSSSSSANPSLYSSGNSRLKPQG